MVPLPEKLLQQLTFYGSYHHNLYNQLIHLVFVPAILWSLLVWTAYSGPLVDGPDPKPHLQWLPPVVSNAVVLNASALIVAAYGVFYVSLEAVAGASWALLVGLPLWISATAFQQNVEHAWAWALGVHLFGWFMQIVPGHAICEKRKPALMDGLWQAISTAPFFVWWEVLFFLHYRPLLYAELQRRVVASIAAHKAAQAATASAVDVKAQPLLSS